MSTRAEHNLRTAALALGFTAIASAGWAATDPFIDQLRDRYAHYEKRVVDGSVVTQQLRLVAGAAGRDVIQDVRLARSGPRFRVETRIAAGDATLPPELSRVETVVIHDGKNLWLFSPVEGKRKLSKEEARDYATARNWWDFLDRATVEPSAPFEGRACRVLRVDNPEFPFQRLWVDEADFTLVRAEGELDEDGTKLVALYSDFRTISDWKVPYRTEIYLDGRLKSEFRVLTMQTGRKLPDDWFDASRVKQTPVNLGRLEEEDAQVEAGGSGTR